MRRALWTLRVLLSHWTRHPMQLATLLIGLMSATALWSGVQAINSEARSSYDRAANAFGRNAMLVPVHDVTVPQALFADLRRAGWLVSPVIEGSVRIDGRPINLVGVEPVSLPRGSAVAPDVERSLQAFLSPAGQTWIAPETAAERRLHEGVTITTDSGESLPPLHIAPGLAPNMLVTDIGFAQRVLRKPERISRFVVDPEPTGARAALGDVAGDRLRLVEAGAETDLQRLTASFHLNLTAFGLLSFLVGLFIVHSAIGLSFEQRLPMLRTLRACGVPASGLVTTLAVELLVLAVMAGVGGVVCGYFIASALLPDVAASLRGLYGASVSGRLTIAPDWLFAGLAMSVAGALVAAAQALAKVTRLPLLVSAQPLAWRTAQQRWLAWQAGLACAAFAVAALSYLTGQSLTAGFAILAGLLLGAALLLPAILSVLLRAGEHAARRPVVLWVWADSRQQLSGLSLALMALLLALAVNVGVGTMVGSFERAFHRWLDGRLAAEIYLAAKDEARANAIEVWLRQRPEVNAILRSARAETKIGGEVVELFGLADHATYRTVWPLLESKGDVWDDVRDGTAVLVSEQLSRRLGLRLGDEIRIPSPGGDWIASITALYADYGNPKGQIVVNADQLRRRFPLADSSRFGLRVTPSAVLSLMGELRQTFGDGIDAMADQAASKAEARRIFSRTFAITAALNAFTLGVAGVALFTSLLTLAEARLPQLAPLWAIGLTRRRIAALEFLKTVSLALLTALLALPLGIVVAWCLIEVVNVRAFGWRLPLTVFPAQLAQLLLVAVLAACLATLLPTIKLSRTRPITLLKIFADER
jgi:putative ABC transport system permease protein